MSKIETDILVVGGGPAGMSAALAASTSRLSVTVVDDNPRLGGQIWRAELGRTKSPEAVRLINAIDNNDIRLLNNALVFDAPEANHLAAETANGRLGIEFSKIVIAAGARERFLPFPGWTLPGVFGAGGLQALVKGGLSIENKRVVIAGTGPLLLAVADYLRSKGARVLLIAEQTSPARIRRFARGLWSVPDKMVQAAAMRARLVGIPYHTDSWVAGCRVNADDPSTLAVNVIRHGKTRLLECDYLACGFHLVPNLELASLLGCRIDDGFVAVDEFQRTSREHVYCAGEQTGIGGIEASLVEGKIAGHAAAGNEAEAREQFAKRVRTQRFAGALDRAFALRDELMHLADEETVLCRCEDVTVGRARPFDSFRVAKLQTRCGMGPCQGRICGAAGEFLFGWERPNVRPPIFPVRLDSL